MDVCHGVSFDMMKNAVAAGLNYYLDENIILGTRALCGITAAVLRIRVPFSDEDDVLVDNLREIIPGKYMNLIEPLEEEFTEGIGITPDDTADEILESLYNETSNLRWGNAAWNRSIGGCFDPTCFRWQGGNVILSDNDSVAVNNLIWLTPEIDTSFYTFSYGPGLTKKGISSSDNTTPDPSEIMESDNVEIYYKNYVYGEYLEISSGEKL